mmetsp:Transcript_582/g.1501  ORF Transcript_582/g.1501 Transcript_582/m.1501 type:complete len:782 (+) Transcript_582:167-2512(+)
MRNVVVRNPIIINQEHTRTNIETSRKIYARNLGWASRWGVRVSQLTGSKASLLGTAELGKGTFSKTVGALTSVENHLNSTAESVVAVLRCHVNVSVLALVLAINDLGHLLGTLDELLLGDETKVEPVAEELAGNAKSGAVLHETDIVDIRNLAATHTHKDPPGNVSKNDLNHILHLVLHDLLAEGLSSRHKGRCEEVCHSSTRTTGGNLLLDSDDINLVVVNCVKGTCCGTGNPCSGGALLRLGDLLLEHLLHHVRLSPHSLSDLSVSDEASCNANIYIAVLVRQPPSGLLDVALGKHGSESERGVDLITSAVEESGVDEDAALLDLANALLEVGTGTSLLIHDTDLEGVGGHAEHLLNAIKHRVDHGNLLRSVELGSHDVHASCTGVLGPAGLLDIVESSKGCNVAVNNVLRHRLVGVCKEDKVVGKVKTNVTHKKHSATRENKLTAVRLSVNAVRVHLTGEGLTVLRELLFEISTHETTPVGVHVSLVLGVDGGDGVLHIADGRQGRLKDDVLDASSVALADLAVSIDFDHNVKVVVAKDDGAEARSALGISYKLFGFRESGSLVGLENELELLAVEAELLHVTKLGAVCEREGLVEECVSVLEDLGTTHRVVALALLGAVGLRRTSISAIESIEKRSPTGVCGVESVARVIHRDDQLRSRGHGDLRVHTLGGNLEGGSLRHDVADRGEECGVVGGIEVILVGKAVRVDLGLDGITFAEQSLVLGSEFLKQGLERLEDLGGRDAGAWGDLLLEDLAESTVDLEATDTHVVGHDCEFLRM